LVPHTKHLHLLLSPVTVFLKRDTFSKIPPLAGDEDFGLDTGKDITELISLQAFTCVECGRCSQHCPATNTGKILNPKEIALGMRGYLNEFGPASEEPLLGDQISGAHLSQEAVFQCTTCGSCEFQCPVGVQHLPMIIGLRRGAVNTGKWEDDYGTKLFLNLERNGNALGFSVERARQIHPEAGTAHLRWHAGVLSLAGLHGRVRSAGQGNHRVASARFPRIERQLRCFAQGECTGDPARRLGNDLAFGQLAETNLETLRETR
jgi:heterodisulfide reductase subunit C